MGDSICELKNTGYTFKINGHPIVVHGFHEKERKLYYWICTYCEWREYDKEQYESFIRDAFKDHKYSEQIIHAILNREKEFNYKY